MLDDEEKKRSFAHWLNKSASEEGAGARTEFLTKGKQRVEIVDVRIPFWSMVWLLVKLTLASIPAGIILFLLYLLALGAGVFAWMGLTG